MVARCRAVAASARIAAPRSDVRRPRSAGAVRYTSTVARDPSFADPTMSHRPSGRRARPAAPGAHHAQLHPSCRRVGADRRRRHAGAVHGERRGRRAGVPQGHGQRLADRGVRHAAALDAHAHAREAAEGKQSGRTQEIQRLIGRSLRAVTDLSRLGERTIRIDCDVLQADGGTRCAAITGACVALADAIRWCKERELVTGEPLQAISSRPCRSASSTACRCSTSTTPRTRRATPT